LIEEKLGSEDVSIVLNSIKCFCLIALSKDWEHKQITLSSSIIDKILGFIFNSKNDEDGQDLQEQGLLFIKNLIFKAKNFGADIASLKKTDEKTPEEESPEFVENWQKA
jgi:hypothetical protein